MPDFSTCSKDVWTSLNIKVSVESLGHNSVVTAHPFFVKLPFQEHPYRLMNTVLLCFAFNSNFVW